MDNVTHEPWPHGQLITHVERYYKCRTAQQVDISLKNPTDERTINESGLGRQMDTILTIETSVVPP